jgi:hypothetical protein
VIAARSKHRPFPLLPVLRRTVEGEQFDVRPGDWQRNPGEAFSSFSHFKTSQFRLCRRLLMNLISEKPPTRLSPETISYICQLSPAREMLVKRKRVRTGCVTCRQRRVKCDEKKPTCDRCSAANVYCDGYDSRRHVEWRIPSPTTSSRQIGARTSPLGPAPPVNWYRADGLPVVGCPTNPTCAERLPHQRAREVLAHHQYNFRTAPLLFREDHLYFWRDLILQAAWDTEYVYDVVLALGTVHRTTLFLSTPLERWKGIGTMVVSLQNYGNALQTVSAQFEYGKQSMDILIAVLLLLAYFEV